LKKVSGTSALKAREWEDQPAGVVNANVFMQEPVPALRPFVKKFVIVEFPFDRELKLLPATSFVAEFRFKGEDVLEGREKLARTAISGLSDTPRKRSYPGGSAILLAMFTEIGAIAFLRIPLHVFFNSTTPMKNVLNGSSELALLEKQLAVANEHAQRIKIVESFLLKHLQKKKLDPIVSAALAHIEETGSNIRIEELARRTGLSQSALERRFRRNVGTSPKRFASILRLRNAIRLRTHGQDFTSIAHSSGYSDQSHFINDFKRLMGFAPSDFFRQSRICKNAEFLQVAFISNS